VVASGVSSPIGFFEGRGGTNLNDVQSTVVLVPQQLSGTGCSGPFFRLPVGVPQPGGDSAIGLTI